MGIFLRPPLIMHLCIHISGSPDDLSTDVADYIFFMHLFCCPRHWGVSYELLNVPQKQKADQASPKHFSAREVELAGMGHTDNKTTYSSHSWTSESKLQMPNSAKHQMMVSYSNTGLDDLYQF